MGFVPFTFVDFIDIILVAVIMYWIYRMTKGTNAPYILSGIIAIYLLWWWCGRSTWNCCRRYSDS